MFYETTYNNMDGLGDSTADCIAAVNARPATYAPAGSQVRVTGTIRAQVTGSNLLTLSNVNAALVSSGYQVIGVGLSGGVVGLYATLTATVKTPIDHSSINDVLSVITGALSSAGFSFSGTVSFVYRPSATDICGGAISGGQVGTPAPGPAGTPPGTPGFFDSLFDSFKSPIAGLGGLTVGVAVGGALALVFLMRK